MSELSLERITKYFGSFVANDRIDLRVESGTIHGLLGENGAGKTTLMNILSGLYRPDAGSIYLDGKRANIASPKDAIASGIGMIHQHFMLVPQLSVTENIILGTKSSWRLNLRAKEWEIGQMSQFYGLEVNPKEKVRDLPIGIQQRVEILKVLYRGAKVLILDEPTAVLTPSEVTRFFQILRQLKSRGHTIIFITHKLEEIMSLCDRVTVLHRGQVVETLHANRTNPQQLARLMVGKEVLSMLNKSPCSLQKVILEVNELEVKDKRNFPVVKNISFQLQAGEILGIAGVDGNGQRELADAIAGLKIPTRGTIKFLEEEITHWSVQRRIKQLSMGYIPEDRQKIGLISPFSIGKNLILKNFNTVNISRNFILKRKQIEEEEERAIAEFDIRISDTKQEVSQLSGGNQQKVILAREFAGNPKLIIAMQPTRGLDIGATKYVQQQLLKARDTGAAILYISSELEEVIEMSDRLAVIYQGTFLTILDDVKDREQIGLLMAGINR
ncbi:MAG: ABC transporter ATP-binding protein [Hydrococcus sp. Prado102]|nr:ABC transporter ATP-binding protein [Hydrococcus sp. Prado102]